MKTTLRKLSYEKLSWVANVLKVISHPVRLEVLEILETKEPLDVSTIQGLLEMDIEQSMLSHHLNKMKANGVLCSEKKGKNNFYSIADRRVLKIFDCIDSCDAV